MSLWGFLGGPVVTNPPASAGDVRDMDLIPGSGRSPGIGNAAHSIVLAWKIHAMDRGAPQATVHGVTKSWTQLSD